MTKNQEQTIQKIVENIVTQITFQLYTKLRVVRITVIFWVIFGWTSLPYSTILSLPHHVWYNSTVIPRLHSQNPNQHLWLENGAPIRAYGRGVHRTAALFCCQFTTQSVQVNAIERQYLGIAEIYYGCSSIVTCARAELQNLRHKIVKSIDFQRLPKYWQSIANWYESFTEYSSKLAKMTV